MQTGKGRYENGEEVECRRKVLDLMGELRQKLSNSLNESTVKGPTQLTRPQVLQTVDSSILHTIPDVKLPARKESFIVQILPKTDKDIRKLFTIAAVTQGSNGEVSINSDGSVSYKPNGSEAESDQFSLTLQDSEGDQVTKTVTLTSPAVCQDDEKRDFFSRVKKFLDNLRGK